ncbi:hypothetical protein CSB37_01795 [bacterium DOLZORAL124_38_8]|nr:MAG: hypothetical protein CSB37_01795 [bacterium DOLZORAL124_38_8]
MKLSLIANKIVAGGCFALFLCGTLFLPPLAHAQQSTETEKSFEAVEDQLFPGWKDDLDLSVDDKSSIPGVIGTEKDQVRIFQYIPRIIDLLLKVVAPIVVVLVLYTGVRLVSGGEDPEEHEKAKDFFVYALIGLAFIVLSYSIMRTVYSLLS